MEAGLQCMEILLKEEVGDWQFFINTVGSALPGRPIQNITDEIIKGQSMSIIPHIHSYFSSMDNMHHPKFYSKEKRPKLLPIEKQLL